MRAAAPVALVHGACIGDLLKSSFANCIASPAGAPAIWPFPFAVWYAVSAAAAISSGASVVEQRFSSSSSAGGSYPSTKERSIILSSASVCTNRIRLESPPKTTIIPPNSLCSASSFVNRSEIVTFQPQALYTEEETEVCAMRLHIRICTKHQDFRKALSERRAARV
ncbi:uncharacterized protein LOC125537674 isoform X2 [Triticum urartu]|uniref:uncharacterized protein LOC125537674 isoform X2 n=1 Tax=Triticum urartu TaxID=4572 RepID=UPI0020435F5A|nr:uncharacterized protein LOC125537674 isoform X2 [Triticum urartu]